MKVVNLAERRARRRGARNPVDMHVQDGLVRCAFPSPLKPLTPDEAEAWADNLKMLAAAAREEANRG